MATTWKDGEIFLGIYNKVQIGLTVTEDGPCWSVDIATDVEGISLVGGGSTLAEAAEKAAEVALGRAIPLKP